MIPDRQSGPPGQGLDHRSWTRRTAVLVQLAFWTVGPAVQLDQTFGLGRFYRGFLRSMLD